MSSVLGIGGLSRASFAELFIDLGVREGLLGAPVLDAARFVVVDHGSRSLEYPLEELYQQYLRVPPRARRYQLLRALDAGGAASRVRAPEYGAVADRLLPRLRSRAQLDLASLDEHNRGRVPRGAFQHVVGDVFATLVIDGEHTMTSVTHPMLAAWGCSFEEALRVAVDNLAKRSKAALVPLSVGLWMAPWDDANAASRVLLTDCLRATAEPVVALPGRDTLLVADGNNDEALARLVSLKGEVADSGRRLTEQLFALTDTRLSPFALPAEHPARLRQERAVAVERARSYEAQQWLLQEAVGDEWYVATAELDETREGGMSSRALWTEGVRALLPEVDRLHLLSARADGTSSRIVVASTALVVALDGVLERTDHLLPRFRTLRFPTDAEIDAVAIPLSRDPATASVSEPGWRP